MCGIAGIASFNGRPVSADTLVSMRDLLTHRGPDDAGLYITPDSRLGFAHRRLSIIDLSAAGHQPMSNEDETVWICFNGEIFNFPDLKASLIKQGHAFRSNCDTEVIIHLYEEYGADCLKRLNGQFAFVIWDQKRQLLFGARDRLGILPLYYCWDGKEFSFASELKSVLKAAGKADLDMGALADFLVLQYVPAPKTIFRHIRKLEAGTFFILKDNKFGIDRYWKPEPAYESSMSESQAMEQLDHLISSSVKRQLISDVPIGVFLSGGVDSSAITSYMSGIMDMPVKAFSVGFEEKEYSELEFAKMAASFIPNVEHHQLVLKADSAMSLVQELFETLDEPFADQAILPTYLMTKYAAENVTVCLSGEGSDEIFGGYDRYLSTIKKVQTIGDLTRFTPDMKPFISDSIRLHYDDYLANLQSFSPKEYSALFPYQLKPKDDFATNQFRDFYNSMDASDDLQRVQRFDISTYLADNLLFKVDRASMLSSLEVRVPLLDYEVVNFCLGLPFHFRYRSHIQKYILKKLMRGRIPNEVIYRKKMGFSVPVFLWFQGAFKNYLNDTLLSKKARERGIIRPAFVETLLDPKRMTIDKHNSLKLWCLLVLEEWFKRYYD
ncbi:MAG: asparagine synthase (glutamine-hydrolyzing) [Nitrospiraceae bacterium]|nr:asparagine synthase (glutamine-hydrolyzing) [Nitrospiraceae bacterium]